MPRYDAASKCPKCGDVATTKYDVLREMMVRECCCCGYAWNEDPLDKRSGEQLHRAAEEAARG